MDNENDVLEFDFPDYEEPYPPFPDVKVEMFDKDSSYSRNRSIADQIYADRQKEDDRRREELRRAELRKMERLNPAALQPKPKAAKIVPIVAAAFAAIAMLATSLTSGGMLKDPDRYEKIVEEKFKPFKKEKGTVVYSTDELSYKIWISVKTSDSLVLTVAIKELTENDHEIQDGSFYISDGTKRIYCQTPVSISRPHGIATVVVQFKKDSDFDCKYFGYHERFPLEKYWTVHTDDIEVSIEKLL